MRQIKKRLLTEKEIIMGNLISNHQGNINEAIIEFRSLFNSKS
jgi:hypothetical protein